MLVPLAQCLRLPVLCRSICVLAGDISPIDVITHIPIVCEDNKVPYIYVPSKEVSHSTHSRHGSTAAVAARLQLAAPSVAQMVVSIYTQAGCTLVPKDLAATLATSCAGGQTYKYYSTCLSSASLLVVCSLLVAQGIR
jgi:hypothetical protein